VAVCEQATEWHIVAFNEMLAGQSSSTCWSFVSQMLIKGTHWVVAMLLAMTHRKPSSIMPDPKATLSVLLKQLHGEI
jgi:hypothetical protein